MKLVQKIGNNLVAALLIAILFILVEQIFRVNNPFLVFNLDSRAFFEQLLIHFVIISLVSSRAIRIVYGVIALLMFVQFTHFSYYGTWVFPLEYMLFFTKFRETMETFSTILSIAFVPLLLTLFFYFSSMYVLKHIEGKRLGVPYLSVVLIIVLLFIPTRVYIKDSVKGAKPNIDINPIRNSMESLGYLAGSIIPKKISGKSNIEQEVKATPPINSTRPDVNVIIVMGESLNRNFMSLYGYEKQTTPYLDSLKKDKAFSYKKAISGGVFTDISLPTFFNILERPDAVEQILSTNTCLFKMAKENGFETSFYSAQATDSLSNIKSYLCTRWIDSYSDGSSRTGEDKVDALDDILLEDIQKNDFTKPQFMVLHQIGSHTPVTWRYPKEFDHFEDKYLNSILYTDYILSQIVQELKKKTDRPTYVVFTSDHSTGHGGKSGKGHGNLNYSQIFEVPYFIYGIGTDINNIVSSYYTDSDYISHYEVSLIIAKLLGYKVDAMVPNDKEGCFVCGNDLNGLAGYLKINFNGETINKKLLNP